MPKSSRQTLSMAQKADRHVLYEESVQDPETELAFVAETFSELTGRALKRLREDFCGTANTAVAWVRQGDDHEAIGVDLDGEVLAWGQRQHVKPLSEQQRTRLRLLQADVRQADTGPVDAVLAMNFSYYLFTTRQALRGYFESVRLTLTEDGVLFLDAFGGYDAHRELEERTEFDEFTYVWDQATFDPIHHHMTCQIHFEFPDGSELKKAFEYHWRLWTLPEIRELLLEAGFSSATVYWEGTDESTGEGDGIYSPSERGDADAGWICYLVARR
ncbi:MAG: class I SAM-dependent methyltransferase [Wenzhouxiangella sp.]